MLTRLGTGHSNVDRASVSDILMLTGLGIGYYNGDQACV